METNEKKVDLNDFVAEKNVIGAAYNGNRCPKCGLAISEGFTKCLRCGTTISTAQRKKSKMPYIVCTVALYVLASVIVYISFYFGDSTRVIEGILEDSLYDTSTLEKEIEISGNVSGASDDCSLILVSSNHYGSKEYTVCLVDKANKTVSEFTYGYTPLDIVLEDIFASDFDLSTKIMESAEEYVVDYGIDCFNDPGRAEEFFCHLTSGAGPVQKGYAQEVLNANIGRILPPVEDDIGNYKIMYGYQNANPMYYIHHGQILVYNWSGSLPEEVYDTWKASTDKRTQDIMVSIYGPPYVFMTLWEAYDSEFNLVARTAESEKRLMEMIED